MRQNERNLFLSPKRALSLLRLDQETSNSTSTRRMEGAKSRSLALRLRPFHMRSKAGSSTSSSAASARKGSQILKADPSGLCEEPRVESKRKRRPGEAGRVLYRHGGLSKCTVRTLPEPSRKELMHVKYKEAGWRVGDVPAPPLVIEDEQEN